MTIRLYFEVAVQFVQSLAHSSQTDAGLRAGSKRGQSREGDNEVFHRFPLALESCIHPPILSILVERSNDLGCVLLPAPDLGYGGA